MESSDTVQTLGDHSVTDSTLSGSRQTESLCSHSRPVDRGNRAYAVLLAAFFIEGFLWGKYL